MGDRKEFNEHEKTRDWMKQLIFFIILIQLGFQGFAQTGVPVDTLYKYLREVEQICGKDNGNLWNKNLYGPILLIDPVTRDIVANQADSESLLQPHKNVYIGKYPDNKTIASGVTFFGGKEWAKISMDFSKVESSELMQTIVHESFHRIQKTIGFDYKAYHNDHMDDMQARISILLEWNALVQAIKTNNEERKWAIKDALLIRQARRAIYRDKQKDENIFEIHEGLAMYTEFKLCSKSRSEFKEKTLKRLDNISNSTASYMRSFGYFSGLLYAYLLDEEDEKWREGLSCNDDLGLKLQDALNINLSSDTAKWYNKVKKQYDYKTIYSKELLRDTEKQKIKETERRMYCEEPILEFELIKARYAIKYVPHPLDSLGTVYPIIDISDEWGFLSVIKKGCLVMEEKGRVTAENIVIEKSSATGLGWQLNLNEGWIIRREINNYIIERK